jgi:hypothetical protein
MADDLAVKSILRIAMISSAVVDAKVGRLSTKGGRLGTEEKGFVRETSCP